MTNPSPPDWRGLCEELLRHAEIAQSIAVGEGLWDGDEDEGLLDRARAALAQPEPEVVGPSDEELLSLDQLRDSWNAQADAMNSWDELGADEIVWWAQRQALARWGRLGPAPAGEVSELVFLIRQIALAWEPDACLLGNMTAGQLTRAADLLEQRQAAPVPVLPEDAQVIEPTKHTILVPAPVPVPVSERLPQPEDCNAEGRCWCFNPAQGFGGMPWWSFEPLEWSEAATHWLPAHALPLPSAEVEP